MILALLVQGDPAMARSSRAAIDFAEAAVAVQRTLADEGFFVPAIRPPSVPHGRSLVRASLSWHHASDDLARLATAIRGAIAP